MTIQELSEEIKRIMNPEKVLLDEPMKNHTTFRAGGNADMYISISDELELVNVLNILKEQSVAYFIIGNGSNLLVSDKGYNGVIIEIGCDFTGIRMINETLVAKSGTLMSSIAHYALENSLTGFEFAGGIPGTIGGGVIMNAGAYGGELKQVISKVRVIMPDGEIRTLSNADLEFEYRNSKAKKEGYIVLQAEIQLLNGNKEVIEAIMRDLSIKRREKQPLEYPSAGSTFKRPEGYFAGKLISDANLKGYSIGGAQVSEKHAGFIINKGDATAQDIYQLMMEVQKKVQDMFKVKLEPEVILLGEFQ